MKRSCLSRKPTLVPQFESFERRLLPAVSVSAVVQDGTDLTGTDASAGPDGIQDLHISLRGMRSATSYDPLESKFVKQITITAPGGFRWVYGPNANASARAEYFAGADSTSGELYLNPTIKSLDGTQEPQSSTGSLISLENQKNLSFEVVYSEQGSESRETFSNVLTGLPSTLAAMPTQATPANIESDAFTVNWSNYPNSGQLTEATLDAPRGFVRLHLTNLTGKIGTAELSDQAGGFNTGLQNFWAYPFENYWALRVVQVGSSSAADIYFAPYRDETKVVGSGAVDSNMMLRITYANDPKQYVTRFAGGPWKTSETAIPPRSGSITVSTADELRMAISNNTGPGTINISAGRQLTLTQQLRIGRSVRIVGNGATLLFQARNWTSAIKGAIVNGSETNTSNFAVDIQNLTIKFDDSYSHSWYDPQRSNYEEFAVINLRNNSHSRNYLNLSNVKITGPKALAATPPGSPDAYHTYVGEFATYLVQTGEFDSGSITDSTFQGGPVALANGPWTITGNKHYGSRAKTYTVAAFSADKSHDIFLDRNTVTQVDPSQSESSGRTFRLINFANFDFGNTVSNNSFTGGGVGDEVSWLPHKQFNEGLNHPEVILTEQSRVFYEGPTGPISADGRVLVIPRPSNQIASRDYNSLELGPGWVVSIIDATNPNAGRWYLIAQQIAVSPPTFLMQTPLPAGKYVISISPGFRNDVYDSNKINILGKSSSGIVLISSFGSRVTNNTFTGGTYNFPYTGRAIDVRGYHTNTSGTTRPTSGAPANTPPDGFRMPYSWTDNTSLDVVIKDNTIRNSVGGITLSLEQQGATAYTGRVYVAATITGNVFEWEQSFLDQWDGTFHGSSSGVKPSQVPTNSSADTSRPPTVTLGYMSAHQSDRDYNKLDRYLDPAGLNVTVQGNSAVVINADSSRAIQPEPSGQADAAVVNGVATDTATARAKIQSLGYRPFNLKNLNIAGGIPLTYDFGPSGQVVAAGYTPVSERTVYSSARGYGWIDDSGNRNNVTRGGGTDLTNDAVYASYMTFQVDLPNGTYTVTPTLGDLGPFAHSAVVYLQETWVGVVATDKHETKAPSYSATVIDGHLQIKLESSPSGPGSDGYALIAGLSIVAQSPAATAVSLTAVFNTVGITSDNNTGVSSSGLDNGGNTYSATALGVSGGTFSWQGHSFTIGTSGTNNVASLGGVGITLLDGQYSTLLVLGAATYGAHEAQFVVHYTDNTSTTFKQTFSDWAGGPNGGGTTAPGESIAATMSFYNSATNGQQNSSRYLYGYRFPLDSSRTVSYMEVNNNNRLKVLAIDLVKSAGTLPTLGDSEFEAVAVGNGGYAYSPTGSAWAFSNGSGVSSNGSGFTGGNPGAPEGSQVAFLQQTSTITQSINFPTGGTFQVRFSAAQRSGYGSLDFQVRVDGVSKGSFTPVGTSYSSHTTSSFTIPAGMHTIAFVGINSSGGDHTVFLDDVGIAAVSSPSSTLRASGATKPAPEQIVPPQNTEAHAKTVSSPIRPPREPARMFHSIRQGVGRPNRGRNQAMIRDEIRANF